MTAVSTSQRYAPGFSRRFGKVFHHWWLTSDGRSDLVQTVSKDLAPWLISYMAEKIGVEDSSVATFKVLNATGGSEQMIWMEMYPDLVAWAKTDKAAQVGGVWFDELGRFFANPGVSAGLSQIMVEDTFPVKGRERQSFLDDHNAFVRWTAIQGEVLTNTQALPGIGTALQTLLDKYGIKANVRIFGMATSAGSDRGLAHLWVEYPDIASMTSHLYAEANEPEFADWKRSFWALAKSCEYSLMLQQVDTRG